MDFLVTLMQLFIYIVPFIVLYFVIAAAVKKGLDSSEVGRVILEKYHAERMKDKK
ncbi:hypothetical protein M3210_05160 [Oceanobacillus luteolus]|uniref:Uncharacterized protein n=1 Tax=Oceanobacillus luteolus TaxID=1274358 RepID=A0ABW4HRQ4_9BACI|nr:hypothetical protein [Oceanobacillus luteolus]MCM3739653.1 hypothetical protein [Oceanobacillus luteolus]